MYRSQKGSLTKIRKKGGQFDPPPSKTHVWCPIMTNDTSLESSDTLLLESEKNRFFCQFQLNSKNVCKKMSQKW